MRRRSQPAVKEARGPRRLACRSSFAVTSRLTRRHLQQPSCSQVSQHMYRETGDCGHLHHATHSSPTSHPMPSQASSPLPRRYVGRHVKVALVVYKDLATPLQHLNHPPSNDAKIAPSQCPSLDKTRTTSSHHDTRMSALQGASPFWLNLTIQQLPLR